MKRTWKRIVLLAMAALWMFCVTASAEGASGDNSLYSLGLENASSCSPDFYYSTLEYNVTVPKGTEELYLSPITSNSDAYIVDISGTTLDESGTGTVYITVEAPNGAQVSYVLYVTSDLAAEAETEAETDAAAAEQAAAESEAQAQAEREETLRREAELQASQEKVTKLTTENEELATRLDLLLKVLYGLVAFAVILLFFIINQSLRNKDLKDDLKEARSQAESSYEFARKEQNMRTDYYYAPVNGMNQNSNMRGAQTQMADASNNMQAVFGNAPQRTQAQPMQQAYVPMQEEEEPQLSKRELKKMEKEAKKAEKKAEKSNRKAAPAQQPMQMQYQQPMQQMPMNQAPMQQPVQQAPVQPQQPMQETYVQATLEEPDVNVDMIEL